MPHGLGYFQTASRNSLSTEGLGKYFREHTKSLQKDGTQIPFYLASEIKEKQHYCNLCCRRERPSVLKSQLLLLKISLKNLKTIQEDYQYFRVHSCRCHYCWPVLVCFSTAAYVARELPENTVY